MRSVRATSAWPAARRIQWRIQAARKQRWLCFYCGERMKSADRLHHPKRVTLDHIIPQCRGGPESFDNVAAACAECNAAKGNMTADEFRKKIAEEG